MAGFGVTTEAATISCGGSPSKATVEEVKAAQTASASDSEVGNLFDSAKAGNKPAVQRLKVLANAGNADAQNCLGVMYYLGKGVPKDEVQSVYWNRKAAEQGHAGAQFSFYYSYYLGKGVPRDVVKAYMWSNLAAANGNNEARLKREELEKQMTREQIAEAQRLSREWKPQK